MITRLGKRIWLLGLIPLIAFGLAWVSSDFHAFTGWTSFLGACLIGTGILVGGWLALREDPALGWIWGLLIGGLMLRLVVGALWYVALPRWGYEGPVEEAGYVMEDAYRRDIAAWELSQSGAPLLSAFREYRSVDQYGGLLYASAMVYRYLGAEQHLPLLMVVITASFSALAIPFTWALARHAWGQREAGIAAVFLAIYPEAILLGSSQMREGFMMTLAAIALYGLMLFWQNRARVGIGLALGAWLVSLPLSPLFAAMMLMTLGLIVVALDRGSHFRNWRVWLAFSAGILVVVAVLWMLGDRILPGSTSDPVTLLREWLRYSAKWQAYLSEHSSGWMQKLFRNTPPWTHIYVLIAYGVVRPFLPAALLATGNGLWRGIAIWRALGWAVLLPFLVYALVRSVRKIRKHSLAAGMSLGMWMVILVAAYRGGGDQWDNPRYRVSFAGLQAALAAWAWVDHRSEPDPWMRRIFIGVVWVFVWFIPWYVRRYTLWDWPVQDVFKTLGLGLASASLYTLWDWAGRRRED